MSCHPTYKKSGAIILNSKLDKCLMVFQKSSSFWGIPKGSKMNKNEDNFVCMLREVKEEIGLNLLDIKFEIIGDIPFPGRTYVYVIKVFLDPLPVFSPPLEFGKENHEIGKIEWVPLKQAYNRKNNSITKKSFLKLRDFLSFPRRNKKL